MNFVLLGEDPRALRLLEELQANPEHELIGLAATGELTGELRTRFPRAEAISRWETLLVRDELDAVILCGSDPAVLEAGRHLAAAGTPISLLPSSDQGSEFLYALSLLYDDQPRALFPAFLDLHSPPVRQLKELLTAGALGAIRYCQVQRQSRGPLTARVIDIRLLPDVALLRHLAGDYNQVTAIYSGVSGEEVSLATVTLAGDRLPEATWTFQGMSTRPDWRLLIVGARGQATLTRATEAGPLELNVEGIAAPAAQSGGTHPAGGALEEFVSYCQGRISKAPWQELIRCQETVEATHRSRKRRRTIDMHFETLSERGQFKSHMTALGCGVLCYTFLALLGLLLVGGLFPQPRAVMLTLRVLAFGPLGVFLVLQLLILIARPDTGGAPRSEKDSSAG